MKIKVNKNGSTVKGLLATIIMIVALTMISIFIYKKVIIGDKIDLYNTAITCMENGQYSDAFDKFCRVGDNYEKTRLYRDYCELCRDVTNFSNEVTLEEFEKNYDKELFKVGKTEYNKGRDYNR